MGGGFAETAWVPADPARAAASRARRRAGRGVGGQPPDGARRAVPPRPAATRGAGARARRGRRARQRRRPGGRRAGRRGRGRRRVRRAPGAGPAARVPPRCTARTAGPTRSVPPVAWTSSSTPSEGRRSSRACAASRRRDGSSRWASPPARSRPSRPTASCGATSPPSACAWRELLDVDPGLFAEHGPPRSTGWSTRGLRPLVDATVDLADGATALRRIEDRAATGKIVLTTR